VDENREIFREKIKLGKFSTVYENFLEIGGIRNGGKCIIASGRMDAPVPTHSSSTQTLLHPSINSSLKISDPSYELTKLFSCYLSTGLLL